MSTPVSNQIVLRALLTLALAMGWVLASPSTALAQAPETEEPEGDSDLGSRLKNLRIPGLGGAAEAAPDSEDGESPAEGAPASADGTAPAGEEGDVQKKGMFNRFLRAFRSDKTGKDAETSESALEVQRKVNQLERDAVRNYNRNRISEAKKNLNDLITLRPYEANYHFALGLCFRKEGRTQDALKKYKDVIDLGGPKPLVHLLMAESKTRDGDRDEVFKELEQAATARNIFLDVNILQPLQKYKTDTEFIKLALSLERIELVSKRSQDPMTNPFKVKGPGPIGPEGTEQGDDELTPEEQKRLYAEARKAYEKVIWLIKLEDEEQAMENYGILNKRLANMNQVTIPRIKHDFQRLASMMEELETQIEGIRLKYYYRQAIDKLKIMKQAFYDTEYAQVETIFAEVKKLAEDMEATNKRYEPVAAQVLKAGNVWIERTRVRQEFDANKPQIQGVIISSRSKQVVINGRIVPQGDRFGQFKVQKVENNKVTFRYKGEEIPLVFRRY